MNNPRFRNPYLPSTQLEEHGNDTESGDASLPRLRQDHPNPPKSPKMLTRLAARKQKTSRNPLGEISVNSMTQEARDSAAQTQCQPNQARYSKLLPSFSVLANDIGQTFERPKTYSVITSSWHFNDLGRCTETIFPSEKEAQANVFRLWSINSGNPDLVKCNLFMNQSGLYKTIVKYNQGMQICYVRHTDNLSLDKWGLIRKGLASGKNSYDCCDCQEHILEQLTPGSTIPTFHIHSFTRQSERWNGSGFNYTKCSLYN